MGERENTPNPPAPFLPRERGRKSGVHLPASMP